MPSRSIHNDTCAQESTQARKFRSARRNFLTHPNALCWLPRPLRGLCCRLPGPPQTIALDRLGPFGVFDRLRTLQHRVRPCHASCCLIFSSNIIPSHLNSTCYKALVSITPNRAPSCLPFPLASASFLCLAAGIKAIAGLAVGSASNPKFEASRILFRRAHRQWTPPRSHLQGDGGLGLQERCVGLGRRLWQEEKESIAHAAHGQRTLEVASVVAGGRAN